LGNISAVAIAHPGGVEFPRDFEACVRPALFLCAEFEHVWADKDRDSGKEILQKRGIWNKVIIYPGAAHGFAVRSVSLTRTDPRIAAMKTMKPRQTQWKKLRQKFWLFLANFSTSRILLESTLSCGVTAMIALG
jgi:dienelactone hydrolase